jgi:mannan endo-1,4-beta-mannosidase
MFKQLVSCLFILWLTLASLYALDRGDANHDALVNINDALLVARYVAGLNPAGVDTQLADTDYSGTLNIVDALLIAKYVAGLITHFNSLDTIPCNPAASQTVKNVLNYLADLSSDHFNGVIAGQNCYHGDQITAGNYLNGYNTLVTDLYNQTGKYPGMIGLDYEHDNIYTAAQLSAANQVLIAYWRQGGLITINWSPHNPWINDESNITANPGNWQDTRTSSPNYNAAVVKLPDLINSGKPIYQVWRRKLDRIATALKELQAAGVPVLWRPMQEANGNWFWWGVASHTSDPSPYINLYRDMYDYFTGVKGLDNLLWVYSPNPGGTTDAIKPATWLYPGNEYVDVVAGTTYNDNLTVTDYLTYVKLGKPMGMGEYGPAASSGNFDNRKYLDTIKANYPCIGYWVSWHNWDNGDGTMTLMSINKNLYAGELMNNTGVITLDKLAF